jgi:hypothetical protein
MPSLFATAATTAGSAVAGGQAIDMVAEGRQLYLTNGCYAYHGLEARGRVCQNTRTDDELFERIVNRKPGTAMAPNRERMSEQEIRPSLLTYVRSGNHRPVCRIFHSAGSPSPTEHLSQTR